MGGGVVARRVGRRRRDCTHETLSLLMKIDSKSSDVIRFSFICFKTGGGKYKQKQFPNDSRNPCDSYSLHLKFMLSMFRAI